MKTKIFLREYFLYIAAIFCFAILLGYGNYRSGYYGDNLFLLYVFMFIILLGAFMYAVYFFICLIMGRIVGCDESYGKLCLREGAVFMTIFVCILLMLGVFGRENFFYRYGALEKLKDLGGKVFLEDLIKDSFLLMDRAHSNGCFTIFYDNSPKSIRKLSANTSMVILVKSNVVDIKLSSGSIGHGWIIMKDSNNKSEEKVVKILDHIYRYGWNHR